MSASAFPCPKEKQREDVLSSIAYSRSRRFLGRTHRKGIGTSAAVHAPLGVDLSKEGGGGQVSLTAAWAVKSAVCPSRSDGALPWTARLSAVSEAQSNAGESHGISP